MLAQTNSSTLRGIDGQRVVVEVHVGNGLPAFNVVGLPDASCREARDRVRAAVLSSGYRWPSARITVNLAPSSVRKEGAGLDLAIAVGVLAAASDHLEGVNLDGFGFVAELGLDGSLRAAPGMLSLVSALDECHSVVVPTTSEAEATLVRGPRVRSCESLGEVIECLAGRACWTEAEIVHPTVEPTDGPDLADVAGHPLARWALEVAATGGHNILLVGPPGTGKSMLARRLPGLLPPLDQATALVASRIQSVVGLRLPAGALATVPPFRAPHHSSSLTALVGGGSGRLIPGEISRAHGGVLFLDELGEFSPRTLDALRQPLEEGVVRVSRAHGSASFPAEFMLVAAMNPCPCGLLGSTEPCRCSDAARHRYRRRLAGPLLDRIDVRVHMQRPSASDLLSSQSGEPTTSVACRVAAARAIARARGVTCNAQIPAADVDRHAPLSDRAHDLVAAALVDGRLSARGMVRARLVARTIADLRDVEVIDEAAMAAALALRARPALLEASGAVDV